MILSPCPAFMPRFSGWKLWASSGSTAAGGLVGSGPQPKEVCALIEQRGIPTIYGNRRGASVIGIVTSHAPQPSPA